MKELINWHELSRKLSGNGQNIRPNHIPKKYEKKSCSFTQNSRSVGTLGKIGHNSYISTSLYRFDYNLLIFKELTKYQYK